MHTVKRTLAGALRGAGAIALVDGARLFAAGRLGRSAIVRREQLAGRVALGALAGALTGARGIRRGLLGAALLVAGTELARRRAGYAPERLERRLSRALGFLAFGLLAGATVQRRSRRDHRRFEPLGRPLPPSWLDRVDEGSEESFPASDPPSFTPGHV